MRKDIKLRVNKEQSEKIQKTSFKNEFHGYHCSYCGMPHSQCSCGRTY